MKNTQGQFFICPCGVYGVFVRAVTVFLLCRCSLTSTLQKPCTCFALFSVSGTLHCYLCKNSASAFSTAATAATYMRPLWGLDYRNVVCPLALRSLKTLRALNMGKNKRGVLLHIFLNFVHIIFMV